MVNEKLIYLAGLMDGEGSFSIQVQHRNTINFNPRLSMSLKYGAEVLNELVDEFGGKLYGPSLDGITRWSLGTVQGTERATRALLPYLRVKHRVAERFLEALSLFPRERTAARRMGEREWTDQAQAAVIAIATTLNPRKAA